MSTLAMPVHPALFEISTRPWLYQLSQKYARTIKLKDIPDSEFQYYKNQGIQIIWMMGIWSLGAYGLNHDRTDPGLLSTFNQVLPGYTKDDIIGSPYAITNYICNPEIGTDADITALRTKLHSMGMLLFLDFVPNHSAVDAPMTTSNPDYYIHSPKGVPIDRSKYLENGIAYGKDPYSGAWTDTAQFNYWNADFRAAQTKVLLKIASLADGARCDMSMLVLNDVISQTWGTELSSWGYKRPSTEFWADAISTVKKQFPDFKLLAEVYWGKESQLQSLGFDFTYEKNLYDKLTNGNLDDIRNWITYQSQDYLRKSAHFITNHDESPAAANFGSWWKADAAAIPTYTLPGMRFHWMGQWEGYKFKLEIHLRRKQQEAAVPDAQAFFTKLNQIIADPVFHNGTWQYLNVFGADTSWRLMAWKWNNGSTKRVIFVNYSDQQGQGKAILPDATGQAGGDQITIKELLNGDSYQRSASDLRNNGLFVIIPSWWAQIFSY